MKGVFINSNDVNSSGVEKKIKSQIEVFNQNGLQCEMKRISRGDERCGLILAGLISLIPGINWLPVWGEAIEYKEYDYLYFRKPGAISYALRKFLRKVKELNPGIRIIMELQTYPYDGEMQSIPMKPFLWKDRYNRKKLRGLVDVLAVVSEEKIEGEIWGIPSIRFQNGYDISNVKIAKEPEKHDCINLCCVAMFQPWHGYERLLLGIEDYYKHGGDRKIVCHMIGEGGESERYKKMAECKYLNGRVIFYGRKLGEELDRLYDQMDIGVCCLGGYKKNMQVSSELKSREYMAKGLPIITGVEIDVFEGKKVDFVCQFENNSSALDMDKIIKFYEELQKKENLREEIHEFALQWMDMSKTMKPIIDYIKK